MFVCPLSPPAFTDRSPPNLAGRPGMGTENTSRDLFPWQPEKWCFYGKIRTVVGSKIACDVTVISDVICDVTLAVTSWKPVVVVARQLGASAFFWAT